MGRGRPGLCFAPIALRTSRNSMMGNSRATCGCRSQPWLRIARMLVDEHQLRLHVHARWFAHVIAELLHEPELVAFKYARLQLAAVDDAPAKAAQYIADLPRGG